MHRTAVARCSPRRDEDPASARTPAQQSPSTVTRFLQRGRQRIEEALASRGLLHTLSLARARLNAAVRRQISAHAHGRCLDAGSGRSPYKRLLTTVGLEVLSVDVENRSGDVDVIADLQRMSEIGDESIDTVLCSQVVEHVPRPWDAMGEIARVLKPGGVTILSVPHLSVVHEAPHDYYRYTRYGLEALCRRADLEVLEITPTGGLLCFLGHGASALIMSTLGSLPLLRWPVWLANYLILVRLLGLLDRLVGMATLYPCDHVLVASKPSIMPS
jgi:SAM-dependent methyltransferase